MDLSRPYAAVAPTVEGAALVALAQTTAPITGRQVAVRAGASQSGVQACLNRLVEHGLVLREGAGRAYLYSLNLDHLAAVPVLRLAEMRNLMLKQLRETLATWKPRPVHASLYGSAARGDGGTSSDIDLFLVRPSGVDDDGAWADQVARLSEAAGRWTGNPVQVVQLTEEDCADLVAAENPLIRKLREESIDLSGVPARRLLRPSRRP